VIGERLLEPWHHVTDAQFVKFSALIEELAGIYLAESKKALLAARLGPRLRELELRDYGAYYERVVNDDAERKLMLDRICTHETQFFREPHHFDFLSRHMIPRWLDEARGGRRLRRLRVWSAGCSTGEEPYSVAMHLASELEGWQISILATDLSRHALARADAAIYPADRATTIPERLRRGCLLRGVRTQQGMVKVAAPIRARVRFERLNLAEEAARAGHGFDLVLCRNVLIYFRPKTRVVVLERLVAALAPSGILLLGHAESLPSPQLPLRVVLPTVYERIEATK